MAGVFISFEGPEGSGKTTQAYRLAERLRQAGVAVTCVREPGGTATGEVIRSLLQHDQLDEPLHDRTETLLFAASRAQVVGQVIRPALAAGQVVVADRYIDSTLAYQGYGRGLDVEFILRLSEFATGGLWPQRTLLLAVPADVGAARMHARNRQQGCGADRLERESRAFHEAVCRGYQALAARWPARYAVIDAAGDIDSVQAAVWADVAAVLGGSVTP